MIDHELAEDLERCADDGHPIVGNTLRCTCGHVDWTTPQAHLVHPITTTSLDTFGSYGYGIG